MFSFFLPPNCKIVLCVKTFVFDIDIVTVFQNRTFTHEAYADEQLKYNDNCTLSVALLKKVLCLERSEQFWHNYTLIDTQISASTWLLCLL